MPGKKAEDLIEGLCLTIERNRKARANEFSREDKQPEGSDSEVDSQDKVSRMIGKSPEFDMWYTEYIRNYKSFKLGTIEKIFMKIVLGPSHIVHAYSSKYPIARWGSHGQLVD